MFFLHLLRRLIFFSTKYVVHSPCWIQRSTLRLFIFYTIFTSCIATQRLSVTLRIYQPVAWIVYQRVIDQSKADIFIKPEIMLFVSWLTNYNDNSWVTMTSHIFLLLICKYYYWTANYDYFLSFDKNDCDIQHIWFQLLSRLHLGYMCLYVVEI